MIWVLPDDIVIAEHENWRSKERKEVGEIIKKEPEDEAVLEKSKGLVGYSFDKNGVIDIKAKNRIGSVYLPNAKRNLNVIPKIFKNKKNDKEYVKDTSILLFYANRNTKTKHVLEGEKNFFKEGKEPFFVDPLHWTLLYEYDELMRQGLLKSYVVHAENISSMRGKLLMNQQMLNDVMRRPKFFCEYDELEYDSIENRVVLQAITTVERTSKNHFVKMKSLNYAQRLSGVVQKENVRRPERQRMMHSYNRQNDHYRDIHQTCEKIIERQGIENIYSGNHSHVVPIFYNMDDEFERFVGNLFKEYYCQKCQSDIKRIKKKLDKLEREKLVKQIIDEHPSHGKSRVDVKTQTPEKAWEGEVLPDRRMRPDIVIQEKYGKEVKEIIDVKYKTKAVIEISDLYQIGFYMHEYGKDNKDPNSIKRAFAIMPKYPGAREGSYTAKKTRKVIHIKRIDVNDCVEKIKRYDEKGLRKIVNSLIQE